MEKDNHSEYIVESKTSYIPMEKDIEDLSGIIDIDEKEYGIGKPQRKIIRAKIITYETTSKKIK
jgi:hypothetical protein